MDIKLNFINRSNDQNNSQVVIFQKNLTTNEDELAVAWTVIRNCGQGDNHPFIFPFTTTVGASDSYGNYTPQLAAEDGQLFQMILTPSGDRLELVGPGTSKTELQVLNNLNRGAINAYVFKDNRLMAQKTGISPQEKAVFSFKPTIWIGVASQVQQGQVVNSAIMSNINTELSLLGIASADIVMTGGGAGANATPFAFNLENVQFA